MTMSNQLSAMVETASKPLPKFSQSIPFLRRPQHLTGKFAGDVGFDPLGLASSPEQVLYHREAEVKHARLAMLAAAGWPVSELLDRSIADEIDADLGLDLTSALDANDRVPSLLNGGMDHVSPVFWGVCLGLAAATDIRGITNSRYSDDSSFGGEYVPGDYGWDPLGLYPSDEAGRARMQLAEIKHGRLSMLAVVAFAAQEFVSKVGVVDETPMFFRPLL